MKESHYESHTLEGNPCNMPSHFHLCNARSGMKRSCQTRGDKNSTKKGHVGRATLEYAQERCESHFLLAWHIKFQEKRIIMSNRHIPSDDNNLTDLRQINYKLSAQALEKNTGQIQVSNRTGRHDGLYFVCTPPFLFQWDRRSSGRSLLISCHFMKTNRVRISCLYYPWKVARSRCLTRPLTIRLLLWLFSQHAMNREILKRQDHLS